METESVSRRYSTAARISMQRTATARRPSCGRARKATETAALLVERGADVNAATSDGRTALMRASYGGHTETAALLVERGADVNAATSNGETALR